MSFWESPRIPEPEVMDEAAEVGAYASAAAQAHLDKIDNSFVEHVLRLGAGHGDALDIGTGPGQIPLKIVSQRPKLSFIGIDRSKTMLEEARRRAQALGLADRVRFQEGDGKNLEFPDASFDLVICNSVLHHLEDPVRLLDEIQRVAKPRGAILVRDLQRPSRFAYPFSAWWNGRHYKGEMRRLFRASVRASYTYKELEELLKQSKLDRARLFRLGRTHMGIARSALVMQTAALT